MASNNSDFEKHLWEAANNLRANSEFKSSEYATPVLGLIFLKYADTKFIQAGSEIRNESGNSLRVKISNKHYQAKRILYLPGEARAQLFTKLLGRQ